MRDRILKSKDGKCAKYTLSEFVTKKTAASDQGTFCFFFEFFNLIQFDKMSHLERKTEKLTIFGNLVPFSEIDAESANATNDEIAQQPSPPTIENINQSLIEDASTISGLEQSNVPAIETTSQFVNKNAPIVDVHEQPIAATENLDQFATENGSIIAEFEQPNVNQLPTEIASSVEQPNVTASESASRFVHENPSCVDAHELPNVSSIGNVNEVNQTVTSGPVLSFDAFAPIQSFAGFGPITPNVSYSQMFGAHSMSSDLFAPHRNHGTLNRDVGMGTDFSSMFGQIGMNAMDHGPLGSMQNRSLVDRILFSMPSAPPYAHNISTAFGAMNQNVGSAFAMHQGFTTIFGSTAQNSASTSTASGFTHGGYQNQNQPVVQSEIIEISDTEITPPTKKIKLEPVKLEPMNETILRRLDFLENENKKLTLHCKSLQKRVIEQRKPDGTWEPAASSTINQENIDPFTTSSSFEEFEN